MAAVTLDVSQVSWHGTPGALLDAQVGVGPVLVPVLEYTCEDMCDNNKLVTFKCIPPSWLIDTNLADRPRSAVGFTALGLRQSDVTVVDGELLISRESANAVSLFRPIRHVVPSADDSPYNTVKDRFRVLKIRVLQ